MTAAASVPPPTSSSGHHPYAPVPYRVRSHQPETKDTFTLTLAPADGGRVPSFQPGQFNMLYAFGVGEVAISLAGDPHRTDEIVHTVRAVGKITTTLTKLRPGQIVGVRGPYGRGWPLDAAVGKDVVVIAGGVGLPPLRPLLYDILARRPRYDRVEVIYGARTPSDLVYYPDLQAWRSRSDLRFQVTVDAAGRDWYGDVGVVTTRLPDARFDESKTVAFLCGPEIMLRKGAEALLALGVPPEAIWVSMERNMKCAIAQCGHCQFGPSFVCRDGPVFNFAQIRPFLSIREI